MDSPRRKYGRMMRGNKESNFPSERALKRNLENRGKARTYEFIGTLCGDSSALKGLVTLYESKIRLERKTVAREMVQDLVKVVELPIPTQDSNVDEDDLSDRTSADGSNYKNENFVKPD